jgi:hypothetical protein
MNFMLKAEALIITIAILPGLIFYKNQPKRPASETSTVESMPFFKALKVLCMKHDYKYQSFLVIM